MPLGRFASAIVRLLYVFSLLQPTSPIRDPLEIQDVWKNSYSANTNLKVWAAKFTARHPNLVALELSSFKCGHDAPIYTVIESIIEKSGTPYFSFKDIDENKPAGSIKIRLETIHYFLKRFVEDLNRRSAAREDLDRQIAEYERTLREQLRREEEFAELAARQHDEARSVRRRILPMLPVPPGRGDTYISSELHA